MTNAISSIRDGTIIRQPPPETRLGLTTGKYAKHGQVVRCAAGSDRNGIVRPPIWTGCTGAAKGLQSPCRDSRCRHHPSRQGPFGRGRRMTVFADGESVALKRGP